jgi:hypothetical protein
MAIALCRNNIATFSPKTGVRRILTVENQTAPEGMTKTEAFKKSWQSYRDARAAGLNDPIVVCFCDVATPMGEMLIRLHATTMLPKMGAKILEPDGTLTPITAPEPIPGMIEILAYSAHMLIGAMEIDGAPPHFLAQFEQLRTVPKGHTFWLIGATAAQISLAPVPKWTE